MAGTYAASEKPANPWGLYDVHGNVWEWTLSPWTDSYEGREDGVSVDPTAVKVTWSETPGGAGRVLRGGGFWFGAVWMRAAYRNDGDPGFEYLNRGFRVVLPAVPEL